MNNSKQEDHSVVVKVASQALKAFMISSGKDLGELEVVVVTPSVTFSKNSRNSSAGVAQVVNNVVHPGGLNNKRKDKI